jgi:hypothetical protein
VPAREDPARFTVIPIEDIHIFIGETNPTPAMETNFWRIGMAETPKRTAFEPDTEEDSSDLELPKLPRSDLKNKPTQPALEVEEVVEDRCESAMINLALETPRYCLVAFTGITSGSTSNGEDSPGESILEALNKSGESDDWDSKGYDSDHYDAIMRRIEAELAQQALEEQNAATKQVFMTNKGNDAGQTTVIRHLRQPMMEMPAKSRVTYHKPPILPWNSFLRSRAAPGLCNPPSLRSST